MASAIDVLWLSRGFGMDGEVMFVVFCGGAVPMAITACVQWLHRFMRKTAGQPARQSGNVTPEDERW